MVYSRLKRLVNLRIPVLLAGFLAAGIGIGSLIIHKNETLLWIIMVIPVTAIILIFLTVLSQKKLSIILLLCSLFFTAGAVSCYFTISSYSYSQLDNGGIYEITATVSEKGITSTGEYIIIKNIKANNLRASGKIIVYLDEVYGDYCEVGYKVTFLGKVYKCDTFPYGKLNYNAHKNIKYSATALNKITATYGFSLFGSINSSVRNALYGNLDGDSASVAYALLTGNTQDMDDGALTTFRYGGIAHIFAVSGLHIGIIYALLCFIGKKIKINKYVYTAIKIFIIFFYAGVCGFTLSSLRAVIMCTVSAIARLLYKKYDGMNALAISVIMILLVSPLSLFAIGFHLSVCAVFAILVLNRKLMRLFKKVPQKISGAVSTAISAQAGTMPVMLSGFGYLSGAGIIMNIVIVPLISALFILLFSGTAIAVIMPFAAPYVIPYAALPLEFVVSLLINCGFEKALLSGFGAGAFSLLYFIGLILAGDKINLKFITRIIALAVTAVLLCTYVLCKIFMPFGGFKIAVSAYYDGGAVLIRSDKGNVLIITEDYPSSKIQTFTSENYATDISAVIVLGGEDCFFNLQEYNCKDFYVYSGHMNIQPYKNLTVHFEDNFSVGGVDFIFADGYSVSANIGGIEVAVCSGKNVPFDSCDLLISDYTDNCTYEHFVSFNIPSEYCIYERGNISFTVKDGKLK